MASSTFASKKQTLFLVLTGLFLTNAIVAEIIGAKIFSVKDTLGEGVAMFLMPLGSVFGYNLAAGALPWPVVFVTSDIINEYFGKQGVKKISYLGAIFIAYSFIIIFAATKMSPADFWIDVNKGNNNFNIDYAFSMIFRQGLGIILGSITAFLVAQLLDATVFQRLRKITGSKMIWLRATGSTLISQLIDSFVVLYIAFYVFGNWTMDQIINVGINNYTYKCVVAILMTPVIYLAHNLIDKYLGKETAHQMAIEAANEMPTAI
ncbi:MAG: queuosine precursor transporter [Spirosomataceae bacterium]